MSEPLISGPPWRLLCADGTTTAVVVNATRPVAARVVLQLADPSRRVSADALRALMLMRAVAAGADTGERERERKRCEVVAM